MLFLVPSLSHSIFFFFQAEDGIRDHCVTGVQTCALPISGFAKLHWIELDLGAWDAQKSLRLLLDGYTDYFTATSMYAADQAGIKVIAPYEIGRASCRERV